MGACWWRVEADCTAQKTIFEPCKLAIGRNVWLKCAGEFETGVSPGLHVQVAFRE